MMSSCGYVELRRFVIATILTVISLAFPFFPNAQAQQQENRSSLAQRRFVDNNNGTLTDTEMGLVWQKGDSNSVMTYDEAVSYCVKLAVGGFKDWRLPTLFELNDLYYKLSWKGEDHRDPIFKWGPVGDYWSQTTGSELGVITSAGSVPIKVDDSAIEVHSFDKSIYMSVGRGGKFAVRAVRGAVSDAYLDRWIAALQDSSDQVRWNALVNKLGQIHGREVKKALPAIERLFQDPNESIRTAAKNLVKRIEAK